MSKEQNHRWHAEAYVSSYLYPEEFAAQSGNCMVFWESLSDDRKRMCAQFVTQIRVLPRAKS